MSCRARAPGSMAILTPLPIDLLTVIGIIKIAARFVDTVRKRAIAELPFAAAVRETQLESVVGAQLMMSRPSKMSSGTPMR